MQHSLAREEWNNRVLDILVERDSVPHAWIEYKRNWCDPDRGMDGDHWYYASKVWDLADHRCEVTANDMADYLEEYYNDYNHETERMAAIEHWFNHCEYVVNVSYRGERLSVVVDDIVSDLKDVTNPIAELPIDCLIRKVYDDDGVYIYRVS